MKTVWTVDFETMPIGPRPEHYPPQPVGVSIRRPDGRSHYYSWAHPSGNNCTWEEGVAAVREVWEDGREIVFHNAKFDTEVAYGRMGMPKLPWYRVHDTMFQAFLMNPYAQSLSLKDLGVIWLGMDKNEQDAVVEWVLANAARLPRFEFITNSKKEPFGNPTKRNAGGWIAFAPGELVGPYAIGDTTRTWRLFQMFTPLIEAAGMNQAYDRERRVLPIFQDQERVGMRVDVERLDVELPMYRKAFAFAEDWLRWRLNAQGLNFDANEDLADVLEREKIITEFKYTAPTKAHPNGKRSTSKDNMTLNMFTDPQVASMLGYRNRLSTCLKMFMEPWYKQGSHRGGWISCNWNQVQSPEGGTRTGRPSTNNPNFLNISKSFEGKPDGYVHPEGFQLPHLPRVRRYILADEGCVMVKRDFSGQELRVFAHFEQGDLMQQYIADPNIDVHHYVGENITKFTGQAHWTEDSSRTALKAMNFQGLYGGGVPALAAALNISAEEAKEFKAFHNKALPGRKILADALTTIVRSGSAVKTWGGRLYIRPKLKREKGRMRDFDYRMINYLVQGSAADITKETMIQLDEHPDYDSRFMLQVYDELNVSAPIEKAAQQMKVMEEVMNSVDLRVKMLSDGEVGLNWGEMKKIKGGKTIEDCLAELGIEQ